MATQPISNLVTTWNAAGTTFSAIKMNVTDTASAAGSLLMDLQVGGSSRFSLIKSGVGVASSEWQAPSIWARSQLYIGSGADIILARDAANTLAQRNSTNAQAFRVYNTFTDASNYERGQFAYSSNILIIGHENAGTGASRAVQIRAGSSHGVALCSQSTVFWQAVSSGHWFAGTDNTYDIGASSGNRPRNVYVAGSYFATANVAVGGSVLIGGGSGNLVLKGQSSGVGTLQDTNQTDFNRLQFGGTTSSFPSLKRNGTAIETKLADDSAYAPHAMQYLDVTDGITAPGAATGRARIYVDTADGDLKVIFADGTIKTIVTDT